MLLAAVIYVPGAGGSFLSRCLCLASNTITGDSGESGRDYLISLTVDEKLHRLNQWNSLDWKQAESLTQPGYRSGEIDFYLYEQSRLAVIDAWHPEEFLQHDQKSQAWEQGAWPWLIEIAVSCQHRTWLESNQSRKNYQLNWDQEHRALQQLRQTYRENWISVPFDHLLTWAQFEPELRQLGQTLELELDLHAVQQLWTQWITRSRQVWQEK